MWGIAPSSAERPLGFPGAWQVRSTRAEVINQNPDLLFLAFLENSKENHQKGKDFFCLPNP